MTHRAEQIIDAIVDFERASTTLGVASENVFPFRSLSLAEDQGEMPALTVNVGDDNPEPDVDTFDEIGSTLEVFTTAYAFAESEPELKRELFRLRAEIPMAFVVNSTLDLDFVVSIRYGGAPAPVIDSDGGRIVGSQVSRWLVTYTMDPADPN